METRRSTAPETGLLSSVRNAARLLKQFSERDRELGVTELARRLGLGKSTVHRLLATLTAESLLERGSAPGTYRLGLALYELGAAVSTHVDLHEAARPVLASLRNATGETVHVAVLDGLEVVHVERLESPHALRIFSVVGHRLPAHCTSTGKVLLAALSPDELAERLDGWEPTRRTARTVASREALLVELARVTERGWAENVEESEIGVGSVGAPVRGADGTVVAAVSVAGPIVRLKGPSLRGFAAAVVEAGAAISTRLGYRG